MKSLSDKDLLNAPDEQSSFKAIYERYRDGLYRKAINKLDSEEDVHDVLQSVFISLWRNRKQIEVACTLAPYLYTALKYAIIKKTCRKAREGMVLSLSVVEISDRYSTQQNPLGFKELKAIIDSEVAYLPSRMRQVYRLSREEHLKNAEIARMLNISEQTVKNTLTVTLKKLRAKLTADTFVD